MITYTTPRPKRSGFLTLTKLKIGERKYELQKLSNSSRQRIQAIINSDAVKTTIEIDEDWKPTIYFRAYTPKAKTLGAAPVEIAAPLPAPVTPPPVEIPAPKVRPGTRFVNGVIDYGTVGVAPLFQERWYLEMTKK